VGAAGRRCVNFVVRWECGKGGGYRYQITTCACLVAGGVVGLLSVLWKVGFVTAVVKWKISSSYGLDESSCVVRAGPLIYCSSVGRIQHNIER